MSLSATLLGQLFLLSFVLGFLLYIKTKNAANAFLCFGICIVLPPIGWIYFGYMMLRKKPVAPS